SQSPFPEKTPRVLQYQGSGRTVLNLWDGSEVFHYNLTQREKTMADLSQLGRNKLTAKSTPLASVESTLRILSDSNLDEKYLRDQLLEVDWRDDSTARKIEELVFRYEEGSRPYGSIRSMIIGRWRQHDPSSALQYIKLNIQRFSPAVAVGL